VEQLILGVVRGNSRWWRREKVI